MAVVLPFHARTHEGKEFPKMDTRSEEEGRELREQAGGLLGMDPVPGFGDGDDPHLGK
jgi:hypothetical protein